MKKSLEGAGQPFFRKVSCRGSGGRAPGSVYFAFFRMRFTAGLQYRAAAWGGIATQFAWGFMLILMYRAFYETNPAAFPMEFSALSSYIWMQQAFLALFATWALEADIYNAITSGQIAYEMARPLDLYAMWSVKACANRLSKAALRCIPIFAVAFFLPEPLRMHLPPDFGAFFLFLVSLCLGLLCMVAWSMIFYSTIFFTISPQGFRVLVATVVDFFAGGTIPLTFWPSPLREIAGLLPFASLQNAPLRIYSGDLSGADAWIAVGLQLFWALVMIAGGRCLFVQAQRRVVVQGG